MFTTTDTNSPLRSREKAVEEINHAIARFRLILQVLEELGNADVPFPGDEEIHRGCERALTSMLVCLARIEPAPPGKPPKTEDAICKLLHGPNAARLMQADQLERLQQFVDRILGTHRQHQ